MSFRERYLNKHIIFEISPGIIFFIVHKGWGINPAIAALIISAIVFVGLGLLVERKIPVFPIVGLILVLVLGGWALVSGNENFIKIKPTIGKVLFAAIVAGGMFLRPPLLARALDGQVYLTANGWKILSIRWILVALIFAIGNEIIWRNYATETWVTFSSFVMPLSILGYIAVTRITAKKYWNNH